MEVKSDIKENLLNLYTKEQLSNENNKLGMKYQSLSDQIYELIKKKIICHKIKPGERIIDQDIAEEFGVSRSSVRQAFNILEKEELLTLIPRNGFYVRKIKRQDVKEIYEIRNILETSATRLAVERIPDNEIKKVEKVFNAAEKDLKNDKVKNCIKADAFLHEMINSNCGNKRLNKMINKYNGHYVFYRIIDLSGIERAKEAYYMHLKIFEAVKSRDVDLSANLMNQHIRQAKKIILENFEEYTNY
ncbi:GntR family transcriptional regulator [Halanaerobium hydrogeniformans]|uniref:Transcriptional regulator, GntR family n=1 Tax=Halanaerobium hydrogeniformans TaxID=656519 RepID=E4RNV9_HALHG|nr:GntR family transcriptional regulator [Halanaerobium hydrogeniformans]ADQ13649.1 transcriptional regulator, GntR family [Halanaerobium hydrogeniformans]